MCLAGREIRLLDMTDLDLSDVLARLAVLFCDTGQLIAGTIKCCLTVHLLSLSDAHLRS